jgi:hypothetical protein
VRNVKLLSRGIVVVGAVACLTLAGCSSEEDSQTEPTLTQVNEVAESDSESEPQDGDGAAEVDDTDVEEIDPATFRDRDSYLFDYSTGGEVVGLCIFDEEEVTCTGTPPDDAPDIEVPPFPEGRPTAATIDEDGVTYTMVEGVPPAPAELSPGQSVTFGDVSCEMSDGPELHCEVGESSLTISGDDRDMVAVGDLQDSEDYAGDEDEDGDDNEVDENDDDADDNDSQIREHYEDSADPVEPGTTCGAATGNTLVEVREGSVSCVEAQEIIDEYRDRRESEGGGNTLAMEVDDWNCSSPTAGRSHELQAAEVCDGPEGRRIATPAGSR